ncbi:MAG: alpha/beta fold hydrolase [Clostridia bacterium]|nr:alpha/beta fold hydrolase [Clostridia bacterium]
MSEHPMPDMTAPAAQPFDFPGDRHGVLLIHGFTGTAAHMRLIGEELAAQGFTVKGINLPGHGTTMEDMAQSDWKQWIHAAKTAVTELQKTCDHVSVAGLSMGGVLTMIIAQQMQITACAPISAPTQVQARGLALAGVAHHFIKHIWWNPPAERQAMLDQRYDYGYPGFPTKCGASLHKLMTLARRNLFAITCPILVVQSHGDETIAPESADTILAGVSSRRKGVMWLDDVPHVLTISKEYKRVAAEIGRLFREAEKA